jgi:Zn-finger nucleic acid-binding protein
MRCPIDGSELRITDRQGIEIDYCPQCRGVWLDRGELDKIIERSESGPVTARAAAPASAPADDRRSEPARRDDDRRRYDDDDDDDDDYKRYQGGSGEYKKKSKKRSFLEDIFDFG